MIVRDVYLYGSLADGLPAGPHKVAADTLPSIVSYFKANYPEVDMAARLRNMRVGVFTGRLDEDRALEDTQVQWTLGSAPEVHIMPEIEGRKKGGVFKAIIGTLLIGAALFFSGGTLAAALPGFLGSLGLSFGSIALMGAGLVLSAFATPPKAEKDSEAKEKQSAMYRGPLNTQGQGDCVPIVYGHGVEAGGVVFHTGLDIEEVPGRGEGEKLDPPVIVEVGR